jgi:diaminohydroxyphosphoribosylaminopyrimidine deaminase / 5-amino-6-(5-phosphoribosylamino)uracil reductase
MTPEEQLMHRTFELAQLSVGKVSPNPRVGCVIVHDGKIIGEGWHQKFGEGHAEVNAIQNVGDRSLLKESTLYVNLEPCSHVGKTPPCADLLIRHQVKKVVISTIDSNPLVGGKGIEKLRQAGIEVEVGILKKEGRELNKRFFTFVEKKRPYIILKWAQTADGFIARSNFDSKWISSEYSRQLVHQWRSEEDAVLVGKNTALYDNPFLTVRDWAGRNPVRVVIDRSLQLPKTLHLFDGTIKTICYNYLLEAEETNVDYVKINEANFTDQLLADLHTRGIQSVIVEGGAKTLNEFIEKNSWDEARVFTSKNVFGAGIAAPKISSLKSTEQLVGDDLLICIKNPSL